MQVLRFAVLSFVVMGCGVGAEAADEAAAETDSALVRNVVQCVTLPGGTRIEKGQEVRSCDGRSRLVMQADGNLVIYKDGVAMWHSLIFGATGNFAAFQTDGNFVLYRGAGTPTFSAGTVGYAGATAELQNDGNFVVTYKGRPVYSTSTGPLFAHSPGQPFRARWRAFRGAECIHPTIICTVKSFNLDFKDEAGATNLCWTRQQPRVLNARAVVPFPATLQAGTGQFASFEGTVVCDP